MGLELTSQALQTHSPWVSILVFVTGGGLFALMERLIGMVQHRFSGGESGVARNPWEVPGTDSGSAKPGNQAESRGLDSGVDSKAATRDWRAGMAGSRRDGLLRIGELAAAAGVSADTVRYDERLGLLGPLARSESGYRG